MRHGTSQRSLYRLFGVLILAIGVMPMTAASATTGTLYVDGPLTLTGDHFGNIVISVNDVTLNCDGYRIVGEDIEDSIGVLLDGRTGVTVKNCLIEGFGWGVGLLDSHGNTIKDNTVTSEQAFVAAVSNENVFKGNTAINSVPDSGAGFFINGSSGNRLSSNRADGFQIGIGAGEIEGDEGFIQSHDNVYTSNVVSGGELAFYLTGEEEGAEVRFTHDNVVTDNLAVGANIGFALGYMSDSTVTSNRAVANGLGFYLSNWSNHNTVADNQATDNSAGIVLAIYATENLVADNLIRDNNLGIGLFDFSTDNTLKENDIRKNFTGFAADGWSADNEVKENRFCHNTEADWKNEENSPTVYIDNKVCGGRR